LHNEFMNKNQNGFSVVILAILFLVLLGIIFIGRNVYENNIKPSSKEAAISGFNLSLSNSTGGLYFLSIDPLSKTGTPPPINANIGSYDSSGIKISIKKDSKVRECPDLCKRPPDGSTVTLPNNLIQANDFKQAKIIISGDGPDSSYTLLKQNFQLSIQQNTKVLTKVTFYPKDVKHVFMYKQSAPADACSYISNDQIKAGLRSAGLTPANDKYPGIDATTDKVLVIQKPADNKTLPLYSFPDGCQIKYDYI
jgi:hypothetical protein